MRADPRLGLGLAALIAIGSIMAGCQRALVCDVSVFAIPGPITPGDALPPDAQLILNAGDFDASQATIGPTDQGTEVHLQLQPDAIQRFREFTSRNLGGFIAITLNGSVVSVPTIQAEIPDGAVSLSLAPADREQNDAFASCIPRRALPEP